MSFVNPLRLIELFSKWLTVLNDFWITLNTPLISVLDDRFSPSLALVRGFLNLLGFGSYSIIDLMLGFGLTVFIVWTLLSWFLNIIN